MANSVNRISAYFEAPYRAASCNELERKLKSFIGKYIIVVYAPNDTSEYDRVTTGGTLSDVFCERVYDPKNNESFNEVRLSFKDREHLILTDASENKEYLVRDTSGIIRWVNTLDTYNRLNRGNYFDQLKEAQLAE